MPSAIRVFKRLSTLLDVTGQSGIIIVSGGTPSFLSSTGTGNVVRDSGATITSPILSDPKLLDAGLDHQVTIVIGDDQSANRQLTFNLNDAGRTIDLSGTLSIGANFVTSGGHALTLTTTGITNVTLPTSGTLATILASGNLLWVDKSGNDGTAVAGRSEKPYLTIAAAVAAASSGDTVVVRPGTYDERNLLKNGVYLHFEAGAVVEYTGTNDGAIFDDSATGANGAVETKITGDGRFIYAGTSAAATTPHVFNITNAGTHIDCTAQEAFMNMTTTPASAPAAIFQSAGYIKFLGHAIEANVGALGVNASCYKWEGGDSDIVVERLLATGNAYIVWGDGTAASSTSWVKANRITSGNFPPIQYDSVDATARLNVDVMTLTSNSLSVGATAGTVVTTNSGVIFLRADRIIVPVVNAYGFGVSGGTLYLTAAEIEDPGTNNSFGTFTITSTGTCYVKGHTITRTSAGKIFNVTGGSLYVQGENLTSNATTGLASRVIFVSGGAATFADCTISMTGRALAPVSCSGGALSLSGCVINAEATTDSITSGTVGIISPCYANRPKNASTTLSPNAGFYDATQSGIIISPLITPNLGTPSAVTLTNATGLPINTGLTIASQAQGDVLYYNGTAWTRLGAGTSGYYLQTQGAGANPQWAAVSGGGTKTIAVFTALDNQPPAANYATFDTRNSIAVLDFDDTTEEAAVFVGIIPEAAVLTSGIMVRIKWMATSATSGDARWGAQFERMNTDEDSDSFDTATEATTTTSGTSGIISTTEITCTTIDSLAIGDGYRLKIYRDVSGADTITGDLEVVSIELRTAN